MKSSMYESMYGKCFNLTHQFSPGPFDGEFAEIITAGPFIVIGFKIGNKNRRVGYEWQILYPFSRVQNIPLVSECGWNITIPNSSDNELVIICTDARHCMIHQLTFVCTEPDARPRPLILDWK